MKCFKKFLFLGMITFCYLKVNGQITFKYNKTQITVDERVINHFGEDYVNQLKDKNPSTLLYFNFFVQNAYRIEDLREKVSSSEVQHFNLKKTNKGNAQVFDANNPQSFNFLAYGAKLEEKQQVFKTGKATEAIIILSKSSFLKAFNQYKQNL